MPSVKIRRVTVVLILAVIAAFGTAAGGVAHGSCSDTNKRFCAFDASNYTAQLTYFVPISGGGPYSVADNKTSSVANHHPSLGVCGVEAEGWPDHTILRAGASQHVVLGSSNNNQIDHFYTC